VEQVAQLQQLCSDQLCVLQTFDLQLMAGIIARADLFIGHDSGLTHLAAALGVNTVALFGPTDPNRWAPRGRHVSVVTGTSCYCEGWDAVRACHEQPCLQIPLEQIIAACALACSH
jgi:ADP-heptose:LPS heptosyltransferase